MAKQLNCNDNSLVLHLSDCNNEPQSANKTNDLILSLTPENMTQHSRIE